MQDRDGEVGKGMGGQRASEDEVQGNVNIVMVMPKQNH